MFGCCFFVASLFCSTAFNYLQLSLRAIIRYVSLAREMYAFFFSALPPASVFVPPPPLWDICVMRVTCHSLCTLLEEKVCIFFMLFACFAQLNQSTARAWLRHETRPNNNSFPFSYKVTKSS